MTTTASNISFSEYIGYEIDNSPFSQTEIADKMGLNNSNIICMYKKGKAKIPLFRIPDIANILRLDPGKMLRMAMREYDAQTADVVEKYLGKVITANETMLLDYIKGKIGTDNDIPRALTADQLKKLDVFIDSLGKKV